MYVCSQAPFFGPSIYTKMVVARKYKVKVRRNTTCEHCGKDFKTAWRLRVHLEGVERSLSRVPRDRKADRHSNHSDRHRPGPFKCLHCESVYSRQHWLKQHLRVSHSRSSAEYISGELLRWATEVSEVNPEVLSDRISSIRVRESGVRVYLADNRFNHLYPDMRES